MVSRRFKGGRRPRITAATPSNNMEHLPSPPALPSCSPPPRAHLPTPRHQRPARIDLTCEGSPARLSTDDHVLVLGSKSGPGARGRRSACDAPCRRTTDDASGRIVRAANERGVRGGLEGGRERGCAKKAVVVMPLEQAGGPVFQTPHVSWTSSRTLQKLFKRSSPSHWNPRNRGRPLPSEKRRARPRAEERA